ncbi:MAG: hypothetical protein N2111_10385 [Candidatus Sumerlaeaceae bacterium]|nr:hypothetical protein [Candidatus Sumerlaeaceae bacterium]
MAGPIVAVIVRRTGEGGWVIDDPGGHLHDEAIGPLLGALADCAVRQGSSGTQARVLVSGHLFAQCAMLADLVSPDGQEPLYRCTESRREGPVPPALLALVGGVPARLYCSAEPVEP